MTASEPERFPESIEFRILYGFTSDPHVRELMPFDYRGILKICPEGVGIYRTGEVLTSPGNWLDLLSHRGVRGFPRDEVSGEIDTSVDTNGIPEHIIPLQTTEILYDERCRHIILRGSGVSWPVLRISRSIFSSGGREEDLLMCLERRLGKRRQVFRSRRSYRILLYLLLAIVAVAAFAFLLRFVTT